MIKIGVIILEVALGLIITVTSIILNPEDLIASAPEVNMIVSSGLNKESSNALPVTSPEPSSSSSQEQPY